MGRVSLTFPICDPGRGDEGAREVVRSPCSHLEVPERERACRRCLVDRGQPLLYYRAVAGHDAGNDIALFALTRESRDKVLAWRIRLRRFAGGVHAGTAAHHGAEHLPCGEIRPDGSQLRRRGVRKPDVDGLRARRAEVARTRRPVLSWRPMSIVRRRFPNQCAESPVNPGYRPAALPYPFPCEAHVACEDASLEMEFTRIP